MDNSPELAEPQPQETTIETTTERIDPEALARKKANDAQEIATLEKNVEESKNFPMAFMLLIRQEDPKSIEYYWKALKQTVNEKKLFTESDEMREKILNEIGTWLSSELRHERYGEQLNEHADLAEHCDLHYLQFMLNQSYSLDQIQVAAQEAFLEELQQLDAEEANQQEQEEDDDIDANAWNEGTIDNPDGLRTLAEADYGPALDQPEEPVISQTPETEAGSFSNNAAGTKGFEPIRSTKQRAPISSTKTHQNAMEIMRRRSAPNSAPQPKPASPATAVPRK